MRLHPILQIALLSLAAAHAPIRATAQAIPVANRGSLVDLTANYTWTHANAPAGQCSCFALNGASGTLVYNLPYSLGIVADIGVNHASNLYGTTQNITTQTYLFGARYTQPVSPRWSLNGQLLAGTSHESSNYVYVQDRSAFTFSAGGGAHLSLGQRFALNLIQADWIHSTLPNGSNDRQNTLRLATGITLHLGSR